VFGAFPRPTEWEAKSFQSQRAGRAVDAGGLCTSGWRETGLGIGAGRIWIGNGRRPTHGSAEALDA